MTNNKHLFLFLSISLFCSSTSFAQIPQRGLSKLLGQLTSTRLIKKHKRNMVPRKKVFPRCKQLSKNCSICNDGIMRTPLVALKKDFKSNLKISAYACATGKSKSIKNKCKILSDFCKICSDGSFKFTMDDSKITSDLYECATNPRTKIGSL